MTKYLLSFADSIPPIWQNCPKAIRRFAVNSTLNNAGIRGAEVFWKEPVAIDALSIFQSHSPGDFFAVGNSTNVEYFARDVAGNSAICSFNVCLSEYNFQY